MATVSQWDAQTGRLLRDLSGHAGLVLGIAFSRDGRRVATTSDDQTARVWEVATAQQLFQLDAHGSIDVAFSPDGRWLATGKAARSLVGHTAHINSVAFSPDSRLLATGSGDGTARLWDVATGQALHSLPGSIGELTGVAFSPQDGSTHLAVAGTDGVVRIFVLRLADLLALADARVVRSLTLGECRQYLHMDQCPAK